MEENAEIYWNGYVLFSTDIGIRKSNEITNVIIKISTEVEIQVSRRSFEFEPRKIGDKIFRNINIR